MRNTVIKCGAALAVVLCIISGVLLYMFQFSVSGTSDVYNGSGIDSAGQYGETAAFLPAQRSRKVIIDPGHGGADGGAVSITGVYESKINLQISNRLDMIFGLYGTPAVMTRSAEEIDYPSEADTIRKKKVADQKARVELINSFENAVLISIHQNKFPASSPSGAQVFYNSVEGSREIGESIQNVLVSSLDQKSGRVASLIPDSIYLMNKAQCPGVLVECGFLSNPGEAGLLQTEEYQIKIASCIFSGYASIARVNDMDGYGGTNEE